MVAVAEVMVEEAGSRCFPHSQLRHTSITRITSRAKELDTRRGKLFSPAATRTSTADSTRSHAGVRILSPGPLDGAELRSADA
jgi:hypothetical protein